MPCYSCVSYVVVFEMSLLAVMTTLFLVFRMSSRRVEPESRSDADGDDGISYGAAWGVSVSNVAMATIDQYGFQLAQLCIAFMYGLYRQLTLFNMTLFLLKYIPAGLYMYKTLKVVYTTSRERIKQKQMELEDIQLQIQIVNTKLCVRDAEFTERAEQLRRGAERLRVVRARVREVIAADDALRRALESGTPWGDEADLRVPTTPDEEREFIITLLKELKTAEQVTIPERQPDKMDCGEHVTRDEPGTPENSVYSSLSDGDTKQDCRVKIIKVTNVYKVAYLKHFIKQKRLRRATQQALLKKKIESIKKLLEGWQKSLNAVINSKLLLDNPIDLASQEAMGDYSKPNLRESSDSDSDLRTNGTDAYYDEYSLSWAQNPYRSYGFTYDDLQQPGIAKEFCDSQEFNSDVKYSDHGTNGCEFGPMPASNVLFILPEETSSQVAIEEIKSEASAEFESDCRDMVAL